MEKTNMTAEEALLKLKEGNRRYLHAKNNPGDISEEVREDTALHGQHPYAVVVACSDSREIPEAVFSCGIGEIFTIRVAGNVIGENQLGSIQYACEHLGTPLVVMLGHTDCGAVGAAMEGHAEGYVGSITRDIMKAIAKEPDSHAASRRNVLYQTEKIKDAFPEEITDGMFKVVGAVYHIADGTIEWL